MGLFTYGIVTATGLSAGIQMYRDHKTDQKMKEIIKNAKLSQILVERNFEHKAQNLKNYWDTLGTIGCPGKPIYISSEFHFTEHKARMLQWYPGYLDNMMQRTLNAVHKAAEMKHVEDPVDLKKWQDKKIKIVTLDLAKNFIFNLEMIQGEKMPGDPVANIVSAGANLKPGSEVLVQIITRPVSHRFNNKGRYYLENYKKSETSPIHVPARYKSIEAMFRPIVVVASSIYTLCTKNQKPINKYSNGDLHKIEQKLSSGTLFDTHIRIVSVADDEFTADKNLYTMIGAFSTISAANSFDVTHLKAKPKLLKELKERKIPPYLHENLLSSNELAYFVHFPAKEVPYVERLKSRKLPVPDGILTFDSHNKALQSGAIPFGYSTFRGITKWLAFQDIKMLRQHAYIIGGTGAGKSTILIAIAKAIISQGGLTFFDVKGTTLERFMGYLSPAERKRVIYVDLSSDDYYVPMNIMAVNMEPYDLANLIVDIFVSAFGERNVQARSQKVLRQAVLAVNITDKHGTIMEVYRMFTDSRYRDERTKLLRELWQKGQYPEVFEYWKKFEGSKKNAYDDGDAQAIINKLEKCMQVTRPRMMLSQRQNILDWDMFMNTKKIVLINLNLGKNPPETKRLFAAMLMAMIRQATFSRLNDGRHENDRETHVTILDEFEEFAKDPEEFERLLAMARECGNGLILTHQSVEQLPGKIMNIIKDNTFTQISMNIGEGSNKAVAQMFPGFDPSDLTSFACDPEEGLEGVCRMKKLNPEPFTFYAPLYWKFYKDYGHVPELVAHLHQRYCVASIQCFKEIEERYNATKGENHVAIKKQSQDQQVSKGGIKRSAGDLPGAIKRPCGSIERLKGTGGNLLQKMCNTPPVSR